MEDKINFQDLVTNTKRLTGFTPDLEATLLEVGPVLKPQLTAVTNAFYDVLVTLPKAQPFLDGRIEGLKRAHINWLESLFTGPFDEGFARTMYNVGMVHVKVKLPVEFMQGAATLIMGELVTVAAQSYGNDSGKLAQVIRAVNGVIGFSVTIMQESYQASSLAEELERFLAITGMSRKLFNNLALAYVDK